MKMMKMNIRALVGVWAVVCLALTGCNKSEPQGTQAKEGATKAGGQGEVKTGPVSAEKTSFKEVTAQLDPGGNLYLYLGTEQWLAALSEKAGKFRDMLSTIPDMKSDDRANLGKAFDVVTNLIKSSGVEDVSGMGVSSIATEPGFYHAKALLHHYKGKGNGFLWTMFGKQAHELDGLSLLPTNTAVAVFSDFELPLLWSTIQQQAGRAGVPQAQEALGKLPEEFEKATGLKWDKVMNSLGGEYGIVLTLDAEKKISLPLPGAPLDIPAPALMIAIKVKDNTIFDRIDTALKNMGMPVASTDKTNIQIRTVAVPLPLPIQLTPTVASGEGYLLIATSDAVIQGALAVKSGQAPGLKTTKEFQRLSKDTPTKGNAFSFVSARFGEAFKAVQSAALAQASKSGGGSVPPQWLESLSGSSESGYGYAVAANTDEGWLAVMNGNQHPGKVALVSAVVPAAMMAGVAVPNFMKARQTAQKNACINNLRQIDGAKQEWVLEKKKTEKDTPTKEDLLEFLKDRKFPVCPAQGEYSINAASEAPRCSIPGHALSEL